MSSTQVTTGDKAENVNEEDLRKELRGLLQKVTRQEPLEMNYKFLLLNGKVTPRKPIFPKDKLYSEKMTADLRKRVEAFGTVHEWDRVSRRLQHEGPLFDESSLRAALTLREPKKHEQKSLLKATQLSQSNPQLLARKDHFEGMCLGLQSKELKMLQKREESQQQAQMRLSQQRENDRQARLEQQRQNRERRRQESLDSQEEEERRTKQAQPSPNVRLSKYLMFFFQKYWDMEFANLGNTNPFRIPIDKSNCAQMGAADYCDVIKKPMNLTWIQQKLKKAQYDGLKGFFDDVDLTIQNCLDYNSDPNNDYHLAALEMKELHKKIRRQVVSNLKKKQAKK